MSVASTLLAEFRTGAGMSQRALARAAGVPPSTIARIESGKMDATIGMLERLAQAAGRRLDITARPAGPTVATVSSESTADAPHWLAARNLADWVFDRPQRAAAAIEDAPKTTGSVAVDSLLAAIAETIADDAGIEPPAWCAATPADPTGWEHSGTPMMKARASATTPARFAARNIWLGRNAIWRDR